MVKWLLLSCHVWVSEWIHSLYLPEYQGTPCSKQAWNLKFEWLRRDWNPQPLSSNSNVHKLNGWVFVYKLSCCGFMSLTVYTFLLRWNFILGWTHSCQSVFTCNQDETSSQDETCRGMKKILFTHEFHPGMKCLHVFFSFFHSRMKFHLCLFDRDKFIPGRNFSCRHPLKKTGI